MCTRQQSIYESFMSSSHLAGAAGFHLHHNHHLYHQEHDSSEFETENTIMEDEIVTPRNFCY